MTRSASTATREPVVERLDRLPLDDIDGLPVWDFAEGDEVVPGHLAIDRLGVGTRCETWLAWSVPMWTSVVVKLARPHQVDHPRGIGAIAREAVALGAVRHPAFPRLWSDGRSGVRPSVVLEYVDGPDLHDVLDDRGPLDGDDLVQLGLQVASALRALHAVGFAHLDLKPDNVAVRNGHAVVLDLGSARPIGRRQPSGRPIGSAGYAAPDLEAGADISAAMDVYGLGVLLAEAALDARVFDAETSPDDGPQVDLPDDLRPELAGIVTAMLAYRPDHRPGIGEVLDVLGGLVPAADGRPWPVAATAVLRGEGPSAAG